MRPVDRPAGPTAGAMDVRGALPRRRMLTGVCPRPLAVTRTPTPWAGSPVMRILCGRTSRGQAGRAPPRGDARTHEQRPQVGQRLRMGLHNAWAHTVCQSTHRTPTGGCPSDRAAQSQSRSSSRMVTHSPHGPRLGVRAHANSQRWRNVHAMERSSAGARRALRQPILPGR